VQNLLPRPWLSRIGNEVWANRSFSCMLTQREIYARIGRTANDGRRFSYIFEDDVAVHPAFAPTDVPGIVDVAERAAVAGGAEMIYLGACSTYRGGRNSRPLVGGRPLGLSRCAVLCTHAYGVSTAAAASLYRRIHRALGSLFAPAMDQNLYLFVTTKSPRERWPLCVAMGQRVAEPDCCRGVFYQARRMFNSTIRQHPGRRRAGPPPPQPQAGRRRAGRGRRRKPRDAVRQLRRERARAERDR
jgi:hypothetical protein